MTRPESAAAWRRVLPVFLLLLAAILWGYRATGLAMVEIWDRSGTFAHAWVVPPIALWLIWRQRAALATLTPRPAPLFLIPFAGAALLWLVGDLAAVNAATQLALVAMLVLAVPTMLGWTVTRAIAFPLGFLFFCVPIGEFMMPQLMEWTADFTVAAVRFSGVPVYREGLQFVIPTGHWSVVEACSGIRYLIASVMVGTLFAYLNYRSLKRRLIFVGVAIALPLLANWLRAYMIVMLGHLSGNTIATGVDHLIYGWVFFGVVMLLLFVIGARWAEPEAEFVPPAAAAGSVATGFSWLAPAALALLIAAPALLSVRLGEAGPSGTPVLRAPALANWSTVPAADEGFRPNFENPSAVLQTAYRPAASGAAAGEVSLYLAYYRQQNYQRKLVSSSNVMVLSEDRRWRVIGRGAAEVEGLKLRSAEVQGDPLNTTGARRLRVWQIYWVNGHWTASDVLAKAWGLLGRLTGQGDDGAALIIHTTIDADLPGADARLGAFLRDNRAALQAWLESVRREDGTPTTTIRNTEGKKQ